MTDDDLTGKIIGCAYKVHNTPGPGFLEKVYENVLRIELEKLGAESQTTGNCLFVDGTLSLHIQPFRLVYERYVSDRVLDSAAAWLRLQGLSGESAVVWKQARERMIYHSSAARTAFSNLA